MEGEQTEPVAGEPIRLDYATPPPRVAWLPKFNGWWVVVGVWVVLMHDQLPILNGRWSLENVQRSAIRWAALAILPRAIVGLSRRDRSWRFLLYAGLLVMLPSIADWATDIAVRCGWVRGRW